MIKISESGESYSRYRQRQRNSIWDVFGEQCVDCFKSRVYGGQGADKSSAP